MVFKVRVMCNMEKIYCPDIFFDISAPTGHEMVMSRYSLVGLATVTIQKRENRRTPNELGYRI